MHLMRCRTLTPDLPVCASVACNGWCSPHQLRRAGQRLSIFLPSSFRAPTSALPSAPCLCLLLRLPAPGSFPRLPSFRFFLYFVSSLPPLSSEPSLSSLVFASCMHVPPLLCAQYEVTSQDSVVQHYRARQFMSRIASLYVKCSAL